MLIKNKTWEKQQARHRYNSMESDDEIAGKGNSYTTHHRQLETNGRTGWLSVDPLMMKYPSMSPYVSMGCNPIMYVDTGGDDPMEGSMSPTTYSYNLKKNDNVLTYAEYSNDDEYAGSRNLNAAFGAGTLGYMVLSKIAPATTNGGLMGAGISGGTELFSQTYTGGNIFSTENYDFTNIDYQALLGKTAKGAIAGASAGMCGKLTFWNQGLFGALSQSAGGIVDRAIRDEKIIDGEEIFTDLVSGATGGYAAGGVRNVNVLKPIARVSGAKCVEKPVNFVVKKSAAEIATKLAEKGMPYYLNFYNSRMTHSGSSGTVNKFSNPGVGLIDP